MTITKRTLLMLVMLVTSIGINAQVDLLRHFGYELASANRTDCIWNATIAYRFSMFK
ncbi:MAG: hypothetical protein II750_02285 [Bacteroidaceae bacterium]|nr:hypothetical protein [Bacteroidaceae bacterium]